jgi:cytosine/adenosine deaminase-related metal-dependent hydrolase
VKKMLIIAERILSHAGKEPLIDGAVVIRYGKIQEVGNRQVLIRRYPRHRVVQLNRAVLMPGLVNVHAHLELPPLLDHIQAHDYPEWVLSLLREKNQLSPRDYSVAVRKNSVSIIESGTTTIADISTHGASPAVLARSGLRAIIYHEIISMGRKLLPPGISRTCCPQSHLISYGLSPHSPHTVSEAVLRNIQAITDRTGKRVCMHVAETEEETRLLRRRKNGLERLYTAAGWDIAWAPQDRSSFSYLLRLGMLKPAFLAVHAVQADDADIAIIKRTGACIAHCPRSNRTLKVGTMPLAKFLRAGIPVGLGTDSLASVASLSMWDEMRYASQIHRASGVTPVDIIRMATLGGAQVLGMDREIGSLEPGKRADCIAVPLPGKDTGALSSDLLRETKSCIMNMVNGNIIYLQRGARRK